MRFTPHTDEALQYSFTPIASDYESESGDDVFEDSDGDSWSSGTSLVLAKNQERSIEKLQNRLLDMKLSERFQLTKEMGEVARIMADREETKAAQIEMNEPRDHKEDATNDKSTREKQDESNDSISRYMDSLRSNPEEMYREAYNKIKEETFSRVKNQGLIVQDMVKREAKRKQEEARKEAERKEKERLERERQEAERRQEEERIKKEQEAQKAAQKAAQEKAALIKKRIQEEKLAAEKKKKAAEAAEAAKGKIVDFSSVEKQFYKYKQDIKDIKTNIVLPMKQNKELKKKIGTQRRRVNPKFGQLTHSQKQLTLVTRGVQELIEQTKGNQLAFKWMLNFVAKAIVHQSEAEVAVNNKAAVPLGTLALDLMLKYPELQYYLMARFVKKCPLVIGYTCKIDTNEGRIRMGWRKRDEDKWETPERYDERLSGIATLYAVMTRLQLSPRYQNYNASQSKHPLPISRSWIMLSRLVDVPLDLVTNVHFVVAGSWWDSCAPQFLQAYGKQGSKLLQLVWNDWTSAVADRKYPGAARLRLLGDDWQNHQKIEQFPALEP